MATLYHHEYHNLKKPGALSAHVFPALPFLKLRFTLFLFFLSLTFLAFDLQIRAQQLPSGSGGLLYEPVQRPPTTWHQLKTPHFSVIYPAGYDSAAWSAGRILEEQYPKAQRLTVGNLDNLPVLLTPQNDRSNGFVSPLNFRMEVDLHPLQGKALNPRSGRWLQTVLPHELVHAFHLNSGQQTGLVGLVSLLSPDLGRSIHTAVPLGIHEGLAVYHESRFVLPGGGRGNYPYFTGLFRGAVAADRPWSMGQLVHFSSYTRPFNRHYVGGYFFTRWLQKTYGPATTRQALDFYARYPFLGYAAALRHSTGKWPAALYDEFMRAEKTVRPEQVQTTRPDSAETGFQLIDLPFEGEEVRRPLWISDHQILFYGDFYDARPGFYIYNLTSDKTSRIYNTRLVGDYWYDLSSGRDTLLYARYHADPLHDGVYQSRVHQLLLPEGEKIAHFPSFDGFAPASESKQFIWSIRNHKTSTLLEKRRLAGDSSILIRRFNPDSLQIIAVRPHPSSPDTLVILARRNGDQGLWITDSARLSSDLQTSPDLAVKGSSLFDPRWSAGGQKLLFTSDHTGRMQTYQYNRSTGSVVQITDHPINAFEASYSPDGDQIAYVVQNGLQKQLAVRKIPPKSTPSSVQNRLNFSGDSTPQPRETLIADSLRRSSRKWNSASYRTGMDWLKPRTVLPYLDPEFGQVGLQMHSTSLLQEHSYGAEFSYGRNQFWYDLRYATRSFIPGLNLRLARQPQSIASDTNRYLDRRRYQIAAPQSIRLETQKHYTALRVKPLVYLLQSRTLTSKSRPVTGLRSVLGVGGEARFYYQLEQDIRDLQPSNGSTYFLQYARSLKDWNTTANPQFLKVGAYQYLSLLPHSNQSLQLGTEWLFTGRDQTVSSRRLGMQTFHPDQLIRHTPSFELHTRYTIPLFYSGEGGFTLPVYLSRIYLVAFSNHVGSTRLPNFSSFSPSTHMRSLYGGGLRITFRLSNLTIDLGLALAIEPTRDDYHLIFGTF